RKLSEIGAVRSGSHFQRTIRGPRGFAWKGSTSILILGTASIRSRRRQPAASVIFSWSIVVEGPTWITTRSSGESFRDRGRASMYWGVGVILGVAANMPGQSRKKLT